MNLLLFESFTRKMLDERDRIYNDVVKKYTESLKNFLHEITDKFTPVKFQIGPGSTGANFNVWFKVEIKDVDEFFEVFHEDIFDRIKSEYPGTTTKFKIGLKRKSAWFVTTLRKTVILDTHTLLFAYLFPKALRLF